MRSGTSGRLTCHPWARRRLRGYVRRPRRANERYRVGLAYLHEETGSRGGLGVDGHESPRKESTRKCVHRWISLDVDRRHRPRKLACSFLGQAVEFRVRGRRDRSSSSRLVRFRTHPFRPAFTSRSVLMRPRSSSSLRSVRGQSTLRSPAGATSCAKRSTENATGVIRTLARPPLWKIE